ncbi:type IV conjugative transfer system coupling protein TraD [Delftia acidovorans]|uniref:Type IV conjugative transfer system coupling protein TraD n=1 Tax=Delftia acidovorans TaxID=80866 RepID=A0AAJ2R934_DELAC|nr:type IV conjugative transfer system coupling protein TraD [Delftia acidovorans]MDX4957820.1 type IV conjugative transfer system coupling protein TraD [Delftia acidovorans]
MSEGVMEGLLRPPVEAWSAATAFGIAGVAAAAPWALMMPHSLGAVTAAIAAGFGCKRTREAYSVYAYQRGLKFTKMTRVAPHQLPGTKDHLYLGEGFAWTQLHTQRKLDTQPVKVREYVKPSPAELRLANAGEQVRKWAETKTDSLLRQLIRRAVDIGGPANPFASGVDLGGSPVLHGVGVQDEKPVLLRQGSRNGHMLVMGTTRVGKTRLLELLCTQDIHAGHVTIVIDPKGDAELMLRMHAEARRAGREKSFYLFHLGYPEISARYNGIGNFARITEVAGRATNALPSSGNSAAFKEFSWRFTNIVAQAQVALGRIPTYESLLKDVTGIDPLFMDYAAMFYRAQAAQGRYKNYQERLAEIQKLLPVKGAIPVSRSMQDRPPEIQAMYVWIKESQPDDKVLLGLAAAVSYERSFYEKIIASLGPFLEKLTSGAVGKLISPDYFDPNDQRPIFDWMTVFRQGGIVYAGLDALSDSVVSSAVGNSMLSDLVSVGGRLYKTGLDPHATEGKLKLPKVCCHFDEVNEIAGPEFVPMVNKLGGSGFQITAYTQSVFDIEARVGDKAKTGQILDNFNHLCMLRVRSAATASLLTDQVPQVNVTHLTPVSGVSDTAATGNGVDFTSRNDDIATTTKAPLIEPSDILELPQGQAFALLEGNRPFKIRIPLADTTNDPFVPKSLKAVAEDMKRRYRTSETWAADTDWMGHNHLGSGGHELIGIDLAHSATKSDSEDTAVSGAQSSALRSTGVIDSIVGGHH